MWDVIAFIASSVLILQCAGCDIPIICKTSEGEGGGGKDYKGRWEGKIQQLILSHKIINVFTVSAKTPLSIHVVAWRCLSEHLTPPLGGGGGGVRPFKTVV